MTATIYQTDNMERAARTMMERNHRAIMFRNHRARRPIRFRGNYISDIPQIIVRPSDSFAGESIERWKVEGGLLQYMHDPWIVMLPEAEAMLYVEAPFQHRDFASQIQHVTREVIVYRPPTWALHERTIEMDFATSNVHHTLECVIKAMCGAKLNPRLQAALDASQFDPERTAVFESSSVTAITGISDRQIRTILQARGFRSRYDRYHCFTPNVAPDPGSDMEWAYDMLCAVDPAYSQQRFLRFECLAPRVKTPGLRMMLRALVRGGYITRHPNIYVVTMGYKPVDYIMIDAIATARRGDWFKMKNIIDNAPKYP